MFLFYSTYVIFLFNVNKKKHNSPKSVYKKLEYFVMFSWVETWSDWVLDFSQVFQYDAKCVSVCFSFCMCVPADFNIAWSYFLFIDFLQPQIWNQQEQDKYFHVSMNQT